MDDYQVSIQELLLTMPQVKFKILSGWRGRNRIIDSLVNYDTTLSDEFTNKLLIIDHNIFNKTNSGIELKDLLSQSPAGIVFTGKAEPYLGTDLITIASKKSIPLVFFSDKSNPQQLQQIFMSVKKLKEIGMFSEYITLADGFYTNMINEMGLPALISFLGVIFNNPVIIVNSHFEPMEILEYHIDNELWQTRLKSIKHAYYQIKRDTNIAKGNINNIQQIIIDETAIENKNEVKVSYFIKKLTVNDSHHGFVIVMDREKDITEFDLTQVNRCSNAVISAFIKYKKILETEMKYKKNFIYDLLHNNYDSEDIIVKQGRVWGWDLSKPHHLINIELSSQQKLLDDEVVEQAEKIIKSVVTSFFQNPITVDIYGQLVVIIPDPTERNKSERRNYIKSIAGMIKKRLLVQLGVSVNQGIGRYYSSTTELCRSYQEAKIALELGKFTKGDSGIKHFEDLGVMRLLANIKTEQLNDFCYEYLQELIEYDKNNESNMLEILQTYFEEDRNFKTVSNKLFIHANTLRYRLKKISEILNVDLENSDDFLNILVAIKIYSMFE